MEQIERTTALHRLLRAGTVRRLPSSTSALGGPACPSPRRKNRCDDQRQDPALAKNESCRTAQYAYVAPFLAQAKEVAWEYLKRFAGSIGPPFKIQSELWVELIDGARIRIHGADNPDRLRGPYLDGVVLDEYADMRPSVWGEVIRPMLADRQGWATFIGTPKGRNEFFPRLAAGAGRSGTGSR